MDAAELERRAKLAAFAKKLERDLLFLGVERAEIDKLSTRGRLELIDILQGRKRRQLRDLMAAPGPG